MFNNGVIYLIVVGCGGYIEGNIIIEVGIVNGDGFLGGDGMVYLGVKLMSLDYLMIDKSCGYSLGWDIVGGGGYFVSNDIWDIYIKGDIKIVLNNIIVCWIYGGFFLGVVEGNIFNILNGGIVDILEGIGY